MGDHSEDGGRTRIVAAARHLFATRGFHQTAMAELAATAQASVGQIYRLFESKNDIIAAIVQEDADLRCGQITQISERMDAGELSVEEAFAQLAMTSLTHGDEALSFEILAEAHRNPPVADTIAQLCSRFRAVIRHLAQAANDRLQNDALNAAEEMMLAWLFGIGHRSLSAPRLSTEQTARITSTMILQALRSTDA